MRVFLLTIFIFMTLPTVSQSAPHSPLISSDVLEKTYQAYILPAYEALHDRMGDLDKELREFCAHPDKDKLVGVRHAYKQAALSWARVEWLRIGPVNTANRVERILFFPDRKSRGLRQIKTALDLNDKNVLLEEPTKKSVAVQGLGALDVILFGNTYPDLFTPDSFACQFAKTVGLNLQVISTTLLQDWKRDKELIKYWGQPSHTNPFYRSDKEALNFLLGTLIHGLQAIKDARLSVFLRELPVRDRPKSAALWRAGLSLPMIRENLVGLKRIFEKSGLAKLPKGKDYYIGPQISQEFDRAIAVATRLIEPVDVLLKNKQGREDLLYLKTSLANIIEYFNELYAPAVGLSAGFSFGDGD